jgi:hypothetical protein
MLFYVLLRTVALNIMKKLMLEIFLLKIQVAIAEYQ